MEIPEYPSIKKKPYIPPYFPLEVGVLKDYPIPNENGIFDFNALLLKEDQKYKSKNFF